MIKVGSKALAADHDLQQKFAQELAGLAKPKRGFVLVTSGAIAFGMKRLGYRTRIIKNGWYRAVVPEGRVVPFNRWFVARR